MSREYDRTSGEEYYDQGAEPGYFYESRRESVEKSFYWAGWEAAETGKEPNCDEAKFGSLECSSYRMGYENCMSQLRRGLPSTN